MPQQPNAVLEYSESGYIRLTYARFCALTFARRQLVEDDDLRRELIDQEVPAFCAGFCDWTDDSSSAQVSVGWAWYISTSDSAQQLAPGGFSSNVMFVSVEGADLGIATTNQLLKAWLSEVSWQSFVGFDDRGNATMCLHSLH
ncbi:MAG: DUF4902 domain-containing protein [Rudaea sp.]